MHGKVVEDQHQFSGWPDRNHLIQKGNEIEAAAPFTALGVSQTGLRLEGPEDPTIGTAAIVGCNARWLTLGCPLVPGIGLGTERAHFIEAEHMSVRRRCLVEANYGPLFSANCGSGRSVK